MNDHRTRVIARSAGEPVSAQAKGKVLIFLAAGLSFLGSIYLWFSGLREEGLFVGLWVPSILSAGALLMAGDDRE